MACHPECAEPAGQPLLAGVGLEPAGRPAALPVGPWRGRGGAVLSRGFLRREARG